MGIFNSGRIDLRGGGFASRVDTATAGDGYTFAPMGTALKVTKCGGGYGRKRASRLQSFSTIFNFSDNRATW